MTREKHLVRTTEPDLRPALKPSALGLITQPGIGAPVLASALPQRAALPPTVEWSLKEIPVEAIGRAFAEPEAASRVRILTWAFQVDAQDPEEMALLDAVQRALDDERELRGFARGARMLPDQIAVAWAHLVRARPEVERAVDTLRSRPHWRGLPFKKRERLPTSPLDRAEMIAGLYAVDRDVMDHAPFLAMADAIEELWQGDGAKVGKFISDTNLQRSIDEVGASRPELIARLNDERERVRRVVDIKQRREKAAELAATGLPPRAPSSVGLAPLIQFKEEKESDLEYPPEELIPLPASATSNTTLRRVLTPEEQGVAEAAAPPAEQTQVDATVVDVPASAPVSTPAPKSEQVGDERAAETPDEARAIEETVHIETAPATSSSRAWIWLAGLACVAVVAALVWSFGFSSDGPVGSTSSAGTTSSPGSSSVTPPSAAPSTGPTVVIPSSAITAPPVDSSAVPPMTGTALPFPSIKSTASALKSSAVPTATTSTPAPTTSASVKPVW